MIEKTKKFDIIHDETTKSFYCDLDGYRCEAVYEFINSSTVDLFQTYVHPDLRGQGIAEALLTGFSDFAREKGLKVNPSCSYAVTFYQRHKEYSGVLAKGTDLKDDGCCRLPEKPSK